ncbi:type II toxin-antitoxin system RelB/DinJ family antitoxin [Levilactobacillus spicheri]|uniref:Damage-inducible protein J n=1 Tax=Levilactobacillus spicheri TaxID=216463 RepID=A0ABQ0WLM1_9LACO|nr:type II toxin-antitoxin system RelB/DinJ family antitoxin [Levilactobacillus spicheri]GEO65684.1 hypothetical protein LSP04_01030 [Levilactobacillus spicheri]
MQDMRTGRINSRINADVKAKAQEELAKNGLTISEYIRIILTGVAEHGLPDNFALPNEAVNASILEMVDAHSKHQSLPGGTTIEELERSLE